MFGLLEFGQIQADQYEQSLRNVIDIIAENPRIASERREYFPPVRVHHHAKHYIIYSIEMEPILISRILRDEADLARHLQTRD
jgi:toxin ParE1/3/4